MTCSLIQRKALQELDGHLLRLYPRIPKVKLIVAGGFVVCSRWCTRPTTKGCDFVRLQEPAPRDFDASIARICAGIAKERNWSSDWMSDKFQMFLPENESEEVDERFLGDCVCQGAVLYDGQVIQAFAVKWEWALASTIDRLFDEEVPAPPYSLQDAVFLLRELVLSAAGKALTWNDFRKICSAYYDIHASQLAEAAKWIAAVYHRQFGTVGLLIS